MDERAFDVLSRRVGAGSTRRTLLGVVAGTIFGGAVDRLPAAAAASKPANARCSAGGQCASGVCIKYGKCKKRGKLTGACRCGCAGDDCPAGASCRNGACFADCPAPTTCVPFNEEICNRKKRCPCWTTDLGLSCISPKAENCDIGCQSSADCATGQVCMELGDCAEGVPQCAAKFCINPCGLGAKEPTTSAATRSSGQRQRRPAGGSRVDLSSLSA